MIDENTPLKTGEAVQIKCDGQAAPATIMLASSNGKSLMLEFDAMIDGCVGMMPVLMGGNGKFYALVSGKEVTIKRRTASDDEFYNDVAQFRLREFRKQ